MQVPRALGVGKTQPISQNFSQTSSLRTLAAAATKVVEAAKMAALQWQGGGARQAARQPQTGTRLTEARLHHRQGRVE
jgi:hypothetical protein